MIPAVISYFAEPIKAAVTLYTNSQVDTNKARQEELLRDVQSSPAKYGCEKVREDVARKINDFIKELGLDPQKIALLIDKNSEDPPAAAAGNIHLGNLKFSSEFIEQINKEFSWKHKFVIAHELGHIVAADGANERYPFVERVGSIARIATGAICFAFCPAGYLGAYVAACGASKVGGYFATKITGILLSRKAETRADRFAAKSKDLIQGGKKFFSDLRALNLARKEEIFRKLSEAEPQASLATKCSILYCRLILTYAITKEGNYRLDFDHPLCTDREKALDEILGDTVS